MRIDIPLLVSLTLAAAPCAAQERLKTIDIEEYDGQSRSECAGYAKGTQTLACVHINEVVACTEVAVLFFTPRLGKRKRYALVEERDNDRQVHKRNLRAVEARLKAEAFVEPSVVLTTADNAKPERAKVAPGVTVGIRGTALTLEKGGKVLRKVSWTLEDPEQQALVHVYQPDPRHLVAVVVLHHPDFMVSETTFHVLPLAAAPAVAPRKVRCKPEAQCPPHYGYVYEALDKLCAGGLNNADVERLAALLAAGRIARRDLVYLFNVAGAFRGYRFKRATYLNAFYYGDKPGAATWLPKACASAIAAGKRAPDKVSKGCSKVQRLWKASK